MHVISKEFSFCFGHRVWSQKLEEGFSDSLHCKCRHLHGHEGKVVVHLSSEVLTRGMVTDFNNLGWLKRFLDDTLDHRFIIDRNDPLFSKLVLSKVDAVFSPVQLDGLVVGMRLNSDKSEGPELEYDESFFIVDFVPTSENFSEWMFNIVSHKMSKLGVTVSKLEWWESPKSCSVYSK